MRHKKHRSKNVHQNLGEAILGFSRRLSPSFTQNYIQILRENFSATVKLAEPLQHNVSKPRITIKCKRKKSITKETLEIDRKIIKKMKEKHGHGYRSTLKSRKHQIFWKTD